MNHSLSSATTVHDGRLSFSVNREAKANTVNTLLHNIINYQTYTQLNLSSYTFIFIFHINIKANSILQY